MRYHDGGGFTQILAGCTVLLRPGGLAVVTPALALPRRAGRPARRRHRRWRPRRPGFRGPLCRAARGLRGGQLIARPSFFQLDDLRRARRHGHPWHLIVHEDVLIFRNPPFPGGSRELEGPQRELKGAVRGSSHVDPRVAGELGTAV